MNAPYALIPVVSLVLLSYLFSFSLTKWRIIRIESHRFTWNLILLVTFIVSGILGLVAVIKVNYRLNIPHYEELLRLHIHVGIGMVIIAFIHFLRHIRYYFPLPGLKNHQKQLDKITIVKPEKPVRTIQLILFLLGFISFSSQLVLIREFLSVFTGNELVIGFFLSLWLILTGTGAIAARRSDLEKFTVRRLKYLILFISLLPLLILFLIYWLKSTLFPPGIAPGPLEILAGIALLLFPVCFLSGYLFVLLTGIVSAIRDKNLIARSYIIEILGSLAGGICFSFLLVFFFRSLEVIAILLAFTGILLWFHQEKGKFNLQTMIIGLLTCFLLVIVFAFELDTRLKMFFFKNQTIIYNKSDLTGNLIITNQEGQLNFYTNNNLEFYTNNVIDIEESAHYAMIQTDNPAKVLIVSGDAAAIAGEVRKYGVKSFDIVMPCKQYYRLIEKFTGQTLTAEGIRTFSGDPIRFLKKKAKGIYDVILLNIPPPSTLKDNRLFTVEFLELVKKYCSPKAIISLQLPSTSNYAGSEALGLNSITYKTLKSVFKEVLLIPGEKNYYLASDRKLSLEIAKKISERGIHNEYVNKNYINDELLKERSDALLSVLNSDASLNHLVNPGAFLLHLREWLAMHGSLYWLFVFSPIILLAFLLFSQTPVRVGLVISGFSASALQIVLIIGFQMFFGNIFYQVSLFFLIFLAGLALGTHSGQTQNASINNFNNWQLGLAGLAFLCILLFASFLKFSDLNNFSILFYLINGSSAFCLGNMFTQAGKIEQHDITGRTSLNYSADLLGSALGTYLSSIFLIPALGIRLSLTLIGALSLVSFMYVFIRRERYNF